MNTQEYEQMASRLDGSFITKEVVAEVEKFLDENWFDYMILPTNNLCIDNTGAVSIYSNSRPAVNLDAASVALVW